MTSDDFEVLVPVPLEPGRAYVIQLHGDVTPETGKRLAEWGAEIDVRFLVLGPDATLLDPKDVELA